MLESWLEVFVELTLVFRVLNRQRPIGAVVGNHEYFVPVGLDCDVRVKILPPESELPAGLELYCTFLSVGINRALTASGWATLTSSWANLRNGPNGEDDENIYRHQTARFTQV